MLFMQKNHDFNDNYAERPPSFSDLSQSRIFPYYFMDVVSTNRSLLSQAFIRRLLSPSKSGHKEVWRHRHPRSRAQLQSLPGERW